VHKSWTQKHDCGDTGSRRDAGRPGFTLIDVLVSMTVIAVLIGLLLPSLSSVNEAARRVACQSNVRQIGLGVVMYANDFNGHLPVSRFVATGQGLARGTDSPEKMVTLRVSRVEVDPASGRDAAWDGLGLLFNTGYVNAPKVFYCPSHRGSNPYSDYARLWTSGDGEINCNFHFRGQGPTSHALINGRVQATSVLWNIDPAQSSLIADAMQIRSDYNHRVGVNFFRADLSVHWFDDPTGDLMDTLPLHKDEADGRAVLNAWNRLDQSANAEVR
jgi:type II secretory pathway pseudopilin PulG